MILDVVCRAFDCPPDVALRQNPKLVFAILEARAAVAAKDKFNAKEKMSPAETDLLHELGKLRREA